MKLTKEQILKIYASFDVKIIWNESKAIDGIHYNDEIDFVNDLYPISTLIHSLRCDNEQYWKYILRPLSSLTEEQEINGERVVPIVGLLKKATSQIWGEPIEIIETPEMLTEGDSSGIIAYNDTERVSLTVDFNEIQRDFSLYIDGGKMMLDKLSLFTQLLSWHFNVFNLPEDEYVDINNLKK